MGDNSSVIKGNELTMINKVCNNTTFLYIYLFRYSDVDVSLYFVYQKI